MSTVHALVLLSVALAVVVVAVLATALILVRRGLHATLEGLTTLDDALVTVEEEHLRGLGPSVEAINEQFDIILSALPGIASKAAVVAEAEAVMTLWWIGNAVLIAVVLPVVIVLLRGVLTEARQIVPVVQHISTVARAASADLDSAPLLLRTQEQAVATIAAVADYGGSLDVILDDAPEVK